MPIDPHPQSACHFAIAREDITPPVGIYQRMWGAATHDRSEGVHRPLFASVLLFRPAIDSPSPEDAFILVALDLCVMCSEELDPIIAGIVEATGLPRSSISVTFAHTHGVGLYSPDRVRLPGGDLIPDFLRRLARSLARMAIVCMDTAGEVRINYGSGRCELAANRDFPDPESRQFVCGYNPGAPADDRLVCARVTRTSGDLVATIINYACHPTSLAWENRLLSPDFPGAMRSLVEGVTAAPCVFIQGASGELGPRRGYSGDVEVADRNGRQLGYAALGVLESIAPAGTDFEYTGTVESGALLGTWADRSLSHSRETAIRRWCFRTLRVDLPYRSDLPTLQQLESDFARWSALEQNGFPAADGAPAPRAETEKAKRLLERRRSLPEGASYPYRVHLLRLGDAIWISVQGEPYSFLQTELRKRFPNQVMIVASISNSWGPAYLPPKETYGTGRYQEGVAVLEAGCLENLIDQVTDALRAMTGTQARATEKP